MPIRRTRALTGAALSGARRQPPFSILTPSKRLKTAAHAGQVTAAARYASGQESQCLRDQSDPVLRQKKSPRGVKRGPRRSLPSKFRGLAVGWQSSGAAMGVFCLMIKSPEL